LLGEAQEELSSATRVPSVETKGELVQVAIPTRNLRLFRAKAVARPTKALCSFVSSCSPFLSTLLQVSLFDRVMGLVLIAKLAVQRFTAGSQIAVTSPETQVLYRKRQRARLMRMAMLGTGALDRAV